MAQANAVVWDGGAASEPNAPSGTQTGSQAASPDFKTAKSLSVRLESRGRTGIALSAVSKRVVEKLERLDVNNDGVVDASEVVAIVNEMAKDQALLKLYRYVTIGLFLVVMILIGALTGIMYGIVQMSKETKVTNFNANYQMMVTKDNQPAITGGALLDLRASLTVLPEAQRAVNLTALANNTNTSTNPSGRRRLQEAAADSLDRLTYYGTVSITTAQQACNLLRYGLSTFLVATPGNTFGGSKLSSITVFEQIGCNTDGNADGNDLDDMSALVQVDQAMTYVILCSVHRGSCDAYYHQDSLVPRVFDGTNSTSNSGPSHRRQLVLPLLIQVIGAAFRVANTVERWYQSIAGMSHCNIRSPGGSCCDVCDSGYTRGSDCGCTEVFCFPAEATVDVLGRGVVRMNELQYGDMVRSYDRRGGTVVHRPIYLFGHRADGGSWSYVHITTAHGRTLAATAGHFVPVCVARCTTEQLSAGAAVIHDRRAGDIQVGDVVLVDGASLPELSVVTSVDVLRAQGAFNPYVRGADLFVDGVVASPHSDWLLDWVAPAWLVRHLPRIYEVLLAPMYGLYCTVGPATFEWLAHDLRWAETGLSSFGYAFIVAALSAPAVVIAVLGKRWLSP